MPASIGRDAVEAEMRCPSASEVGRVPMTFTKKYRASGRGGDMWMRENKPAVNAAAAEMQSASGDSSLVPLKRKLLASLKKCVGWRLFRALPKEEQEWWMKEAAEEGSYLGFTSKVMPEASPARDKGTGKPLKRKQDAAMAKAFVDATNDVLTDGDGVARDERLAKRMCETALRVGLSMRKSKQLVPSLGRQLTGIKGFATRRPARPPPAQKISDEDIFESLKRQSVGSCRWSATLKRPKRTLLASRRCVWSLLPELNQNMSYRLFCHRTTHVKLGVARANSRYH